jgi:hypothetical protein
MSDDSIIYKLDNEFSAVLFIVSLLFRAPPCFGRRVKPLVPAAFAVVSTHQPALGPRGGFEGLCPSSGDINVLMMKLSCIKSFYNKLTKA